MEGNYPIASECFDRYIFILAGSIVPRLSGGILAMHK